jgi:hypothetical protein
LTHAVLVAFTGDMPSARRIARDAQGAFSLKALGNIDRMMEFLSLFGQEPLIVRGDKKPDPELLRLAWDLTKNLQLFEVMGKGAAFPPLVGKRFAFFPVRLFTLIQFSRFDSAEKLVSDLLEVHPEGTLYMLQGYLLFAQQMFAQQKYQSAIDPFRKAITTPALHPKARHESLFGLAVCATYAGMGFTGIKDEIEKEKLLQEAVIAIRELASHSE